MPPTFKAWLEKRIQDMDREIEAAKRDRVAVGTVVFLVNKRRKYQQALVNAKKGFHTGS
ncbi:MAG: hypothetical protein Q8R28_21540 [Dehalococcoidia bacterium]|nr:hypothetical protein [Dehalococcoidia bacterium]